MVADADAERDQIERLTAWRGQRNEAAVKNGLEGCVLFARLRLGGN